MPLVLYDRNLTALVVSPINNAMVGVQLVSGHLLGQFACGLNGKISAVPQGYSYQTIIVAGSSPTAAMQVSGHKGT